MAAKDLVEGSDGRLRCPWAGSQPDYLAYHDLEWGRPVHDELRLFEKLCLEGFQAGLSWYTILRKRDAFRRAFAGFEPVRVAAFGEADVDRLLANAGIVRSRRKIEATIANARALLALGDTTLERLVWAHAPARHRAPRRSGQVPASIPESTALAVELKRRGFRMVGATTVYAMMQACGVVNDHLTGCFVRDELDATPRPPSRLSSRGPGPDSGSPGGPGRLLPADGALAMRPHDPLHPLDEPGVAVAGHGLGLVAADVQVGTRGERGQLADHVVQEPVRHRLVEAQ